MILHTRFSKNTSLLLLQSIACLWLSTGIIGDYTQYANISCATLRVMTDDVLNHYEMRARLQA